MTTLQVRYVNMYRAMKDYLNLNAGITKNLPNFEAFFTAFLNFIDRIMLIAEMQKDTFTGAAKEKKRLRDNLMTLASDNSDAITAFAKFTSNELLLDQVKFNISDLIRMTGVDLKNYAQVIYNKVETNIGLLAPYGVTPETLKIFNDAIVAFDASLAKPRVGITEKAKATNELNKLFESADSMLENIDTAVKIIRRKEPNFYKGYTSNRMLVDTGSGKIALKASVKELTNGEPVHAALFTFTHEADKYAGGTGIGEIAKKTTKKGNFHIKNMKAGTYKVVVSKPGYKDKAVTVSITDGERSDLNVELEKA
jgi:Carboxypeptidase regulatory-like domain